MAEQKKPRDAVTLPAECCARCRFVIEVPAQPGQMLDLRAGPLLACRAHPPQVYAVLSGVGLAIGSAPPGVQPSQWCGEFQAAPPVLSGK